MHKGLVALGFALACFLSADAARADGTRLVSIDIEGRLLEPKQKLLTFLGLTPGMLFEEKDQERLTSDLQALLGYRVLETRLDPVPGGVALKLRVEPVRVVRRIMIAGNWPLFDDDILRNLRVHSGSELVADDELRQFLDEEEGHIVAYLAREGYFGGSAHITPRIAGRPDWIDLDIRIRLGQWYKLGAILADGNHDIGTDELFSTFDHCCFRWGRFGVARMREDARDAEHILHDRGFPGARVRPDFVLSRDADPKTGRVRLPVLVTEKRRVEVSFEGNHALSDKELREQLTLFSAGAYDEIELVESEKALHRAYQLQGYFEAKVTHSRQRVSDALERVRFHVDEGPELKVRRVEVVAESGAALPFSEDEIRSAAALETRVFPRLGVIGLGQGGYVTQLQLHQDEERIAEFYRQHGFPQPKVRAEVARDPAAFDAIGALGAEVAAELGKNDLYVRFYVDEGHQERVSQLKVSFRGAHDKTVAEIRAALKMTEGQVYSNTAFLEDQNRIVGVYKSSGHPYVSVSYEDSKWDGAHEQFSLHYTVDEGPRVTFGAVLIRGNFKTLDSVILADLPFRPGQVFDRTKLERGERNLQTHNIFNGATVKPVGLAAGRNPVPILVTVRERYLERAGMLAVAFGVSTDKPPNYAYAAGIWTWNNFAGFGSQLELRAETGFSAQTWGVSLRYTDLRIFGPDWRFDFNGFGRSEFTYRLGTVLTAGLSLGLTRYVTPALRLYLRYDNYLSNVKVPVTRLDGSNDVSAVGDNTHTTKLTTGVTWDRRIGSDGVANPLLPWKGWLLAASVGWAFPSVTGNDREAASVFLGAGGQHNFLVLSGQALGIYPVRIRSVEFALLANFRYDEGIPFGESSLPVVERYFAGGDTTTRGYDPDQLKTEIVRQNVAPLPGQPGFRVIPQGGNIRLLSTLELQFPIAKTFLTLKIPWAGAIFYDVGAIADAPNLIALSDFKHSIGVSLLRLITPFGPLSLEYAYPLTQTAAEERWKTNPWYSHFPGRIHFNWGIPVRL